MDIKKEYERIKSLFEGCDPNMLQLVDGTIWEAAKMRVELERLGMIADQSGLVSYNKSNPVYQKELPVSKLLTRQRANYLNYITKLGTILGKVELEDEDDLTEFE